MGNKYNTSIFIRKAKEIHGDKYNYSKVVYSGTYNKVKIICPEHGEFEQKCTYHLRGMGCKFCSGNKVDTQESFIEKVRYTHGDKYDYSLVEYVNTHKKIKIICPKHGEFEQRPHGHSIGQGCPTCGKLGMIEKLSSNTEEFIEKSEKVHGNKYNYTKVDYNGSFSKVVISCPNHGEFNQDPSSHLRGQGCPNCKNSKMENIVVNLLKNLNIEFTQEKTFPECRDKNPLRFDFYLPKYNLCIECDGEQHYRVMKFNGGLSGYKGTKKRDKIKDVYCQNNNIHLLRVSYKDDTVSSVMECLSNHVDTTSFDSV